MLDGLQQLLACWRQQQGQGQKWLRMPRLVRWLGRGWEGALVLLHISKQAELV
jgi:hypothetical protein